MKRFSSAIVIALLGAACGGGNGGGGDAGDPAVERGRAVATASACTSCHGADYSGGTVAMGGAYPPNITPDEAHGIGGWTDAQIITAVRTGVDDEGATLCPTMTRFASMSDQDANDLVAFLRSVPPSTNDAPAGACAVP